MGEMCQYIVFTWIKLYPAKFVLMKIVKSLYICFTKIVHNVIYKKKLNEVVAIMKVTYQETISVEKLII